MASLDELKKKYLPQQSTQTTPVRNEAEPQSAAPAGNASESYLDRLKKKYIPTVDQNYINSFMTDADSFLGSAQRDYGSISPETVTSVYSTRRQTASDLRKRAFAIRQYLDDNKGSIEADKYDSLISYLDNYDKVSNQSMMDFAAAMKSFDTTGMSGYDAFMAEKQEKEQKEDDKTWWEKALAAFAHTSDSTLPAAGVTEAYHGYREDTTYREPDERWNDDQRNTFGYLYAIDPERAYEYALEVNNALNAGEKQEKLDKISDSAKDNKVGHTLGAIAASPLGLADYLSDLTESAARGTITQKEFVTPFEYSQAATGAIAQDLNEKGGTIDEDVFILGGKGWGDVYSLGFSAAQSLISAYTLGGTGTLVTFIGIGGAAGVDDALARGATPDQALLYGSIVGAAEGAAEMINADNLIKITSSKTLSKYLLAMLNQGLGESVEEGATAIIENVADNIIMADKSNYHAAVEAYISAGMTEEEAKRKAWTDMVGEVLYSAMGGFVTGAGNAAVVGGVKNTMENAEAKKLYGESQQELVAEGRESAEGSESRKLADKYQQKLDRGKNLSGAQLSRLVDANERQFVAEDMANIKQAAEARLTELGEVDGVSELAGILAKQAAGQSLSKAEQSRLESSRYGKRVANELNPENVRSGEYTSGWAQGIETNRINVDEYNRIVEAAQTAQEAQEPAVVQEVAEVENTVQAQETPATEAAVETVEEAEAAEEIAEVEEDTEAPVVSLEEVSAKFGAQAGAMVHTYVAGQDVAKYDRAYGAAYDMGKSGVNLSYAMNSAATAYLSETQRELAYAAGKAASDSAAGEQAEKNAKAANGKTGRKVGAVRGEGVNIADLRKSFNDTQGTAYKVLSTYAEATGIDIVLYKSEANAEGDFEGAQGKFKWSEDTIYIDINAGLANVKSVNDLAKYAMLRTFSHEFTHFLEKWNPVRYNEFRKVVFDTLTERGENVHDLIEEKMAQNTGMEYDAASREVVAEAMTDILPDTTFVHTLAEKHKSIFDKLLERLKEFAADLKKYFSTIGHNRDRGANALKEQVGEAVKYMDSIVKLFDEVALEAVENYQRTVAVEEVAEAETEQGEEIAEPAAEVAAPEVETITEEGAGDAFTITDNREFGTLEIKFDGKPAEAIREVLKAHKFRWHGKKGIWYGKAERADIVRALREAYQSETVGETTETVFETTETVIETTEEVKKDAETVDAGRNSNDEETSSGAREENGDRSGIPEVVGEADEGLQEESAGERLHRGGINSGKELYQSDDYIQPEEGTALYDLQKKALDEYGLKLHIIKAAAWGRENPAFAFRGEIYVAENIEEDMLSDVIPHEATHAMRLWKFKPYLDFIERTPDMLDFLSEDTDRLVGMIENHVGVDFVDMTDHQHSKFYDELNSSVYGLEKGGAIADSEYGYEWIPNAFHDFDAYINELSTIHEQFKAERTHKEVETHVETEHADNGRSVLESDTDGQGAARLLDELQDEDVSRTASERDAVGAAGQRESSAGRDGDRPDAGAGDSRSDGSGESGDLRRDELTAEATAAAEQLQTVVEEQIEQKSTEEPKGRNFVIGDSLNLPDGEKARFHANVAAIRLIKQLESEGRFATEAEQEVLSKYIGWGGLDKAFGEYRFNRETRKSEMAAKDGWEKEFAELRSLVDDGIITEQEYKDMSASTKNAHYTSIEVIKAMYDGLAGLGFKGGRMLEPSSGVGNFVGAMPTEMSAKVNSWTMVELDRVTGLIAKYLYPNADVRIQGFETANIPDNYMDVAIGNVPFGNFGVVDRAYPKRITKAIHNYFFAKSIDKVRPGGIVMFITSSFTMNASDTTVRQYMMERADLLGAIRLPNTAFKGNAGTEVVTDILILKKRESGTEYAGEDFLEADYDSNYGTYTSNYFKNHPEMVLGKPVVKRGMYGSGTLTFEPFTDRGTIDEQIREAFKHIKGEMSYPAQRTPEKTNFAVEKAGKKAKAGGFVVHADGSISQNRNGQLVKIDTDEKTAKRIAGMVGIRDAYKTLANHLQQGVEAKYIKQARTALNKAYDAFVAEYGYLNSPANRKAIEGDPDRYAILSLENFDPKKKTAKKADIFTKDTISPNKTITHVDSVGEGVIASINLTGGVDADLVAKLTDRTVEDVTREIIESRVAFKTRGGALVARESYLSGNVRAKLREAEALLPFDKDYAHNVEELRRVIPADIPYNEIYITPGNAFIPNEVYADFIAHMLGGRNRESSYSAPDVEVGRTASGEFKIVVNNKRLKNSHYNTQTWGTARKSFLDLIDAMMGSRSIRVNDTIENADGKKISVLNEAETEAANEKAKAIQKEFEEWVWQDEERRTALARLYNETFNAIVNPKYDGSHLSVNGINADFSLRPHQANAVHRIIASGGNTLLAHRVGAGKTLEMAAAAMKLRELGVVKKPVFVVPKSLVAQWGVEFHSYFPASRLLVADDKSFTPGSRRIFTNQIANGDFDAVIVSYEQFEKIPMSVEYQQRFYEEQIDEIIAAIAEEKAESRDGKGMTVKEMEKKKAQLEKKLKELTSKPKDDDNVNFEMLGIDSLFVDEAHNFKNLEYVSKMSNVAGLGSAKGSQRAFDLYTKIRYLQGLNGGRGIVFATATPVMNSMVELYIMQKYLQPDILDRLGLKSFDAWAKQFGEVVNKWEINPSGTGMRQKQVFANFRNLNELQLLFRSFSDVLTEVPGLKIPKMKGGAVKIVECEPGEFQKNFMQELQKRAENVKNVDPSVDNMLKITSDGRKVSYTQRMIDPSLPYEPGSKIFRAADNVLAEYKASADIKGTQIVFLDMATPKGTDKSKADAVAEDSTDESYDEESARLYDDMRDYLAKKGIPRKEIAFIHEADSDAKRKQLFEDVNNGKVRVLIGSTGKMGVGMNAQKRIVAIHHLDAPWRPGDVEQRDGRAFRQKNMNEEVSKYVYVTKGSFDSRLWDILDRKQHFINQIMNGEDVGRTAEDTGEVTLSAAEVKALASGNPLIEEQTKLTDEIKKLENLLKAYHSSIRLAKTKLSDDEQNIAFHKNRIEYIREDIKARVDTYSEGKFSMTVGGKVYTDKKDAGMALVSEIMEKAGKDAYVTVGKFAGFELRAIRNGAEFSGLIHGKGSYKFNVYVSNTTRMVGHIGEVIAGFENMIKNSEQVIADATADRAVQQDILAKPFEKQDELSAKRARFNEVMEQLAPKTEQQLGNDTEQEQSRAYLGEEQEQQRTDTLTDRDVLALAAREIKVDNLSAGEQDALRIFRERLSKLEQLEEDRAKQGRLYKEQQFGAKPDRAAAEATLNRMHVLDSQIAKASVEVLDVEDKKVLKTVLQKARRVVETEERAHGQEMLARWRDRRNNAAAIKKYRERLRGDVDDLTNWVLHPDNKDIVKRIPDALKNSVIPFLSSINFMSKQALRGKKGNTKADELFLENMKKLNAALKNNIDINGLYSGYNDLPPNFMDNLQRFIASTEALVKKSSGEFIINKMTAEELQELSKVVRTLKKYIMQVNRFHYNAMYQHVFEAGDNTIDTLKEMDAAKGTGKISEFLMWQQIRPAYAFERFGEGGKSIYDGLRRGQAQLAFNTQKIVDFSEKTYTAAEVQAWEKELKTFYVGGDKLQIPVSTIMSIYRLSKDPEARYHMEGDGFRVATYTHDGKKISDVGHRFTTGEINQIIRALTPRQREVADQLQGFMAEQGGKWGNYVSVARFGEELFTNKDYFPINSDGRHLAGNTDEEHPSAAALYALLNMSFTKSRKEKAKNRIVVYSIFDVFANHMASMAQYNAMALPILDAVKWFHYQQVWIDEEGNKEVIGNVREQMARVYGVPEETRPGKGNAGYAVAFVENIIKAFNGTEAQGIPTDETGLSALRRYNMAQVAFNFRVVVQQPLAITRAGMLVDYRSILRGLKANPATIRKNIEDMRKYSGIAAWKALGFYDINISRGLTDIIKHKSTLGDKISDVGMWGAEKADILTWAAMWSAAKEEIRRKMHLSEEDARYYEEVTKLFEDIIYKTQVVDSVLTKNEFLRSKGAFARLVGSFMSEPTTTASMLIDAYDKYQADMQRGMDRRQAWEENKRRIGRLAYVYGLSAVMLAAVQAVADAWRDDDDYQTFLEKWLEAFGGNMVDELMPINKLPILSDFYELVKSMLEALGMDTYGNPPQSVFMQWRDSLVKGTEIIYQKISGEDTNYTWYGGAYKLLQAASGMVGLPMAAATRELVSVWNSTVGSFAPSLKVKSYEPSELSQIKYAYEDGHLTAEEATEQLLAKGLVDNEDEAYFTIAGWEAGEGYSRYDAMYDAIRNGGNVNEALAELTSHGYTEEEVFSQVKGQIGKWYREGEISKAQATEMLTKYSRYFDMSSDEITATVNKWSAKVVTGIDFEDIGDEYEAGKITASRAIEMYMRYGGYTREEAQQKVTLIDFVKKHPTLEGISYAAVESYKEHAEGAGITAETFYDVWKYNSETQADVDASGKAISGSKKDKVLSYIHSMRLTAAQKDSLYYAFGWAESKINEAPWR